MPMTEEDRRHLCMRAHVLQLAVFCTVYQRCRMNDGWIGWLSVCITCTFIATRCRARMSNIESVVMLISGVHGIYIMTLFDCASLSLISKKDGDSF